MSEKTNDKCARNQTTKSAELLDFEQLVDKFVLQTNHNHEISIKNVNELEETIVSFAAKNIQMPVLDVDIIKQNQVVQAEIAELESIVDRLDAYIADFPANADDNLLNTFQLCVEKSKQTIANYSLSNNLIHDLYTDVSPAQKQERSPSILLSTLLPAENSEDVIANLDDLFDIWTARYGPVKAKYVYYNQAMGCVFSAHKVRIGKLLVWLVGAGFVKSISNLFK